MSKTFEASSVLIGTVIGAGILGIPYVIMKSGYLPGLIYLVGMAAIIIFMNLLIGEIILRTKKRHQLTGYAEKYLGKKGKTLMTLSFAVGIFSALIAYLIGEGASISHILFGSSSYEIHFAIAFWLIMSGLVFFEIRSLKKVMPVGVILVAVLIISLAVLYWNKIDVSNLSYINPQNLFFPFGVILFAFLGFSAMPEMERIVGKDKYLTKRVIIISYLVVLALYIVFATIVLGAKGLNVPQISTISLGKPFILLGMFTMFTAYLSLSIAFLDLIHTDYKKSKLSSWLIVALVPLIMYLILKITNSADFVSVLGIGGVISGGLNAILILYMSEKAKSQGDRKPEYKIPLPKFIKWFIIIVFIAGAVSQILIKLS